MYVLSNYSNVLIQKMGIFPFHVQHNRINRLKQAAEIFVRQIVEIGSWVGIVTFNNVAQIKTTLLQIIGDDVRDFLIRLLPTSASGGTSICSGVRKGFDVRKKIVIIFISLCFFLTFFPIINIAFEFKY